MKLQGHRKLVLTEEEKDTLNKASDILYKIGELMERAISVERSPYEDEEIWELVKLSTASRAETETVIKERKSLCKVL